MKSPIKWVGGKSWLAPKLVEKWRHTGFDTYFEPFCGGFAVGLALLEAGLDDTVGASDLNPDLINFWITLQRWPQDLISEAMKLESFHITDPEFFYTHTRSHYNDTRGDQTVIRAAQFLYLNKTGFNGLYRVNKAGKFNVPRGSNQGEFVDAENLMAVSGLIKNVIFTVQSYDNIEANSADLVYMDPPYIPTSATANFVGYTSDGFDHARFAQFCASLSCETWVSNSDTEITRSLFRGWDLEEVSRSGTVNCKADKRGRVGELLFRKC